MTGRELDFFEVRYKEALIYRVCSRYQRRSEGANSIRIMRVNCAGDNVQSSAVLIVFTNLDAIGFNLAEIEVHSLGEFFAV